MKLPRKVWQDRSGRAGPAGMKPKEHHATMRRMQIGDMLREMSRGARMLGQDVKKLRKTLGGS